MITASIGVACNKWQSYQWWPVLRAIEKDAERHGIRVVDLFTEPGSDVGRNRSKITRRFRQTATQWLMFIDDDTIPPTNALSLLMAIGHPFVAGAYFYKDGSDAHQFAPLMYRRVETGRYTPVVDYHRGEILTVDAVGLGCSLIHRALFDKIAAGQNVGLRPDGAVEFVAKGTDKRHRRGLKIGECSSWEKHEHLPFFVTAGGRTEDYYFAELAASVGVRPVVDTMIECQHIGDYGYGGKDFRDLRKVRERRLSAGRQVVDRSLAAV
jgi:hypothetical protein